jgi:hypothetical protein
MKGIAFAMLAALILIFNSCETGSYENDNNKAVDNAIERAKAQSWLMVKTLKDRPDELPRTIDGDGNLVTSDAGWWCSGFFPGQLWLLSEYPFDQILRARAHSYTCRLEDQKNNKTTHDLGFMIFCSFGNAYLQTYDNYYKEVLYTASKSLAARFNPLIGAIRSWDYAEWNKQWQYPVIIDNMMNLEMLMWASKQFDEPQFADIAKTHANTTIENHFREDNSSYHVVSFDTTTGLPELKHTSQGYSHESAWARGQAWGLYGFTMMFRETGDSVYLNQAQAIANFIISHPNLPEDKIPYWDFNAPDIPNAKRDASAGAIICSALLELSRFSSQQDSIKYLQVAERQLLTLCSDEYLAEEGENGNFILKHGVGHMPNNSEVDVPLSYADYYFVEALTRYKNWYIDGE